MKNRILFATILLTCFCSGIYAAETKIMVISDPHVLVNTLFDDSTALKKATNSDPKLFEYSQELFDSAMVRIQAAKPDILLIPGDLTKDGELASHMYVAGELNKLVEAGIKVFIVPGNHDITNPNASSYIGAKKESVASIAANDFKSLYNNMGYGDAVLRQGNGLSYMVYPVDSLAIICLNSAQPNNTKQYSAGGLTEETLAWAESAAEKAKEDERYIIAMMHHPVVEHFNMHATLSPTYIANQEDSFPSLSSMQDRLTEAGIELMFTGHFHITSIQHSGDLYDISTGSTCAYASPIRSLTFSEGGMLHVTTDYITKYHELEQLRNAQTAKGAIRSVANRLYPTVDSLRNMVSGMTYGSIVLAMMNLPNSASEMTSDMEGYMLEAYTDLVNVLSHGDEDQLQPDTVYQHCMDALDAYTDHIWGTDGEATLLLDQVRKILDTTTTLPIKLSVGTVIRSIVNNYVTLPSNYVPDGTFDIQLPSNIKEQETGLAEQVNNIQMPKKTLRNGILVIEYNGKTYTVLGTQAE